MNENKMRVVAVLCYPYDDAVVFTVTRSTSHFASKRTVKSYRIPYSSPLLKSMMNKAVKLMGMQVLSNIHALSLKSGGKNVL